MTCWFDRPVRIEVGRLRIVRSIVSAEEAEECMLHQWPSGGGRLFQVARKACDQVRAGAANRQMARRAFADAAREVDILVPD